MPRQVAFTYFLLFTYIGMGPVMVLQKARTVADLERLNIKIVAVEKRIVEQRLRIQHRAINKFSLSTLEQSRTLLNQLEDALELYKRLRQLLIALLADSTV